MIGADSRYGRVLTTPARTEILIIDRLVHNGYQINLKGESMRKRLKKLDSNRPLG